MSVRNKLITLFYALSLLQSVTVELRTGKTMCRAAQPEADWGFFEVHLVGASENYNVNRDRGAKVMSFVEAELGLPQTRWVMTTTTTTRFLMSLS